MRVCTRTSCSLGMHSVQSSGLLLRLARRTGCISTNISGRSQPLRLSLRQALGEKAVLEVFPEATIVRPAVLIGTEDRIFNEYAKLAKLAPLYPLPDGGQGKLQPVRLPWLCPNAPC